MWAGGSFTWPSPSDSVNGSDNEWKKRTLKIGREVVERRSIDKIDYKDKGDMIFIHQRREIWDANLEGREGMWGVKEVRTHVFRPPPSPSPSPLVSPSPAPPLHTGKKTNEEKEETQPDISFTFTPTSPLLFRYSALTFNAHKIHYDHPHSIHIENQPAPLVHGPLTATLLVELAAQEAEKRKVTLVHFDYRAVGPIVVDREVEMVGWFKGGVLELIARQGGRVGMKASARFA
jgi:hydroxyacyl-ACP dehydratase HTD2-like protein with hotdog domain